MNQELKATIVVCFTILVVLALIIGGILANRYIRQQDTRPVTDFAVTITLPESFSCYMTATGESSGQATLTCKHK